MVNSFTTCVFVFLYVATGQNNGWCLFVTAADEDSLSDLLVLQAVFPSLGIKKTHKKLYNIY